VLLLIFWFPYVVFVSGPQFISKVFEEECEKLKIEHERIPYNTPNKNANIESFHRLLEEDCLSKNDFSNYTQAYISVLSYIYYYNNVRIHSGTEYYSPVEYSRMIKKILKKKICWGIEN
jgi:putative transposase